MRRFVLLLVMLALSLPFAPLVGADTRPRVLVMTDISNEPDDEQSLVRVLVYSNEFDVEGPIATTSTWLKDKPREDLIRGQIDAYAANHACGQVAGDSSGFGPWQSKPRFRSARHPGHHAMNDRRIQRVDRRAYGRVRF